MQRLGKINTSYPINRAHPLARGLVNCWRVMPHWSGGGTWYDLAGRNNVALAGGPTWRSDGLGFDGTDDAASVPLDLSRYDKLTISFWMYSTFAFSMTLEHSTDYNANNGFAVYSDGSGAIVVGYTKTGNLYWVDSFPTPSASAWHHYTLTMDRANRANTAYVDGTLQTLTTVSHTATAGGNFANLTLYIMSRAGTTLFVAGRLNDLRFYNRILSASEAKAIYTDPLGVFNRVRVPIGRSQSVLPLFRHHYVSQGIA